jgi:hypothetical protein
VIRTISHDVTHAPPSAVQVSLQSTARSAPGSVSREGTRGTGAEGDRGAGLGVAGASSLDGAAFGPEFTVTFGSNPGPLKSLEVVTEDLHNPGSPDYWVASTRQGQSRSRFTEALGRVSALRYGSRLLYTNSDWSDRCGGAGGGGRGQGQGQGAQRGRRECRACSECRVQCRVQ